MLLVAGLLPVADLRLVADLPLVADLLLRSRPIIWYCCEKAYCNALRRPIPAHPPLDARHLFIACPSCGAAPLLQLLLLLLVQIRRPDLCLEYGEKLLAYGKGLGDELWVIHEQASFKPSQNQTKPNQTIPSLTETQTQRERMRDSLRAAINTTVRGI